MNLHVASPMDPSPALSRGQRLPRLHAGRDCLVMPCYRGPFLVVVVFRRV